jgi:ubiquinone biosynthesis UbiH/UbiF/VisC/COQ6 family hydroxylase
MTIVSTRRRESVDFAVIGDGPVGLAAAISLAQAGHAVALVAASEAPQVESDTDSTTLDSRVYALAPDVLAQLDALGCAIAQHRRACSYSTMRVFDTDAENAANMLCFQASDYGWRQLGSIVEHRVLVQELWRRVAGLGIKTLIGQAQSYAMEDALAVLHVGAGASAQQTLRARWIVDASGANSTLRNAAGISLASYDYQQSAIVAQVQLRAAASDKQRTDHAPTGQARTAWQRFTANGTIALLPTFEDSNAFALVYSALEVKAQALMGLTDAAFLADLAQQFGSAAGQFEHVGTRRKIPLQRALAARYLDGALILLGDSAHTVHPLAGQGLNMGLRDARCLLHACAQADLDGALDTSRFSAALRRFERERKSENAITALGIEALQKLFLPASGPLKLLRNFGLSAVQHTAPIKRLFAELAAGKVAGWR